MKLTIELVPSSAWFDNFRNLVEKSVWNNIRKEEYKRAEYKCEICGISDTKLNCHEIWSYDDKKHIQKLNGFIVLCDNCHWIKHIGLAGILSNKGKLDYEKLIRHFCDVNNCSKEDFEKHMKEAFEKWKERSKFQWKHDFGKWTEFAKEDMKNKNMEKMIDYLKSNAKLWIFFGKKHFKCAGEVSDKMIDYFKKNKKLPEPCDKCYKALIFWGKYYSTEDEFFLLKKIRNFDEDNIYGKFNTDVAVFYFETKEELMKFLPILEKKMKELELHGIIEWRIACKEYQDRVPEYWKNAKELIS